MRKWWRRYNYIVWFVKFNDSQKKYARLIALTIMLKVQWLRIQAIMNRVF